MEKSELDFYRENIDKIDIVISECIDRRMALSREIGKIKKEEGLPLKDEAREEAVRNRLKTLHPSVSDEIDTVYSAIFKASREVQKRELSDDR